MNNDAALVQLELSSRPLDREPALRGPLFARWYGWMNRCSPVSFQGVGYAGACSPSLKRSEPLARNQLLNTSPQSETAGGKEFHGIE